MLQRSGIGGRGTSIADKKICSELSMIMADVTSKATSDLFP